MELGTIVAIGAAAVAVVAAIVAWTGAVVARRQVVEAAERAAAALGDILPTFYVTPYAGGYREVGLRFELNNFNRHDVEVTALSVGVPDGIGVRYSYGGVGEPEGKGGEQLHVLDVARRVIRAPGIHPQAAEPSKRYVTLTLSREGDAASEQEVDGHVYGHYVILGDDMRERPFARPFKVAFIADEPVAAPPAAQTGTS